MAEEKSPEEKGSKKKLFIIIGAVAILLIGLGIGGFLWLKASLKADEAAVPEVPVITQPSASLGPIVDINDFVVNIISGDEPHFVKAALSVELSSEGTAEEVNMRMPQMRDAIILILGNKDYRELQDIQGKKQLKAEIQARLNDILQSGKVVSVYLTDFVVQ